MLFMKRNSNKPFFICIGRIFFGIIVVVFVLSLILPDRTFSEKENRVLSSFPAFNLKQMAAGREEAKYETYVNDQFMIRDAWITLKAAADFCLGKVENNGVWLCSGGYLMENFTEPDEEKLNELVTSINDFGDRDGDLPIYMMVVPNAVDILSYRLPAGAQVADQDRYIDLKASVSEHNISFIDLRDTLTSHNNERIYYKTDHHWTTMAAYYAYREAADTLKLDPSIISYEQLPVSNSFQGTLSAKSGFRSGEEEEMFVFLPKADTAPEYVVSYVTERVKTASCYHPERLETRDKYALFFDGNHAKVTVTNPSAEDRTILVLKDSYANCFLPFLIPHFREIVIIDPRYFFGDVDELIASMEIDEVLLLYNANTFFSDTSLPLLLNEKDMSDEMRQRLKEMREERESAPEQMIETDPVGDAVIDEAEEYESYDYSSGEEYNYDSDYDYDNEYNSDYDSGTDYGYDEDYYYSDGYDYDEDSEYDDY